MLEINIFTIQKFTWLLCFKGTTFIMKEVNKQIWQVVTKNVTKWEERKPDEPDKKKEIIYLKAHKKSWLIIGI